MPLSRRSTWVAIGVAALTVLGSASSAFADRNMYTRSRAGVGPQYGHHRHMASPFGPHRKMRHHYRHRRMY